MRQMIRATVLAACLAVLAVSAAGAAEKSTDPGEQIKDGAIQVGQGIKHGAINLWEATKSAFSGGADKVSHSSKDSTGASDKTPQPAPHNPAEK